MTWFGARMILVQHGGARCKNATSPYGASPFDKMSSTIGFLTEFCLKFMYHICNMELGCTNDNQCKTWTDLIKFKPIWFDLNHFRKRKREGKTTGLISAKESQAARGSVIERPRREPALLYTPVPNAIPRAWPRMPLTSRRSHNSDDAWTPFPRTTSVD